MNTTDKSSTADNSAFREPREPIEINTDKTSNTGNTTKQARLDELKRLYVVSSLWTITIIVLSYWASNTEDIRVDLLLALAMLIGIPMSTWTYMAFSKYKEAI
jgi:hypothetical protein